MILVLAIAIDVLSVPKCKSVVIMQVSEFPDTSIGIFNTF